MLQRYHGHAEVVDGGAVRIIGIIEGADGADGVGG